MALTLFRRRTFKPGTQNSGRPRIKRRTWRLPALLAAIALCLVWVYSVDFSHAAAIVAGAIVMGLCNEFADGLSTQRLTPVKLKGLEQGATEQQFLAYSLTGDRPVGERAYRHFVRLAKGRLAKLGIGLEADDGGTQAGHRPSQLLYRVVTDPERGGRLTHAELTKCLDELDALDRSGPTPRESRPAA